MFARVGHQAVIALGEGRVDLPRCVGRGEQRLAEQGVTGFRRSAVAGVASRGVERWDEPGERAGAGERTEPARITEAPEDLGGVDGADAGDRAQDVRGVKSTSHHVDPLIELVDLGPKAQSEAGLDREIVGELAIVDLVTPQLDRLVRRVEGRLGVLGIPATVRMAGVRRSRSD